MGPHVVGRLRALARLDEPASDQLGRHDAGRDNALVAVHIGDEGVDGGEPLHQAGGHPIPFGAGDRPGHDVEGPGPVDAQTFLVDGERDPRGIDAGDGGLLAGDQAVEPDPVEMAHERGRGGSGRSLTVDQFVPRLTQSPPRCHSVECYPDAVNRGFPRCFGVVNDPCTPVRGRGLHRNPVGLVRSLA